MKLKKFLSAAGAAALLAVGSVVATAPQADAADLTPMGRTLCNATRCELSTPIKIAPDGWQEGRPVAVNVVGRPGATISVRLFATKVVSSSDWSVTPISAATPVTLPASSSGYSQTRISVTPTAIPSGYNGAEVLVQPADYHRDAAVIERSDGSGEADVIEVRSARGRDMGFKPTSFTTVMGRELDAAIPGDRYSVQILRAGKWVTIDDKGPATVSAYGTANVAGRVPSDLPTGRYRTRLVNVTRGLYDISPDASYTYFTWTYQATKPTDPGFDVYTTPGLWDYNGRKWRTTCEPYSQTERCRTEIWATQIIYSAGTFSRVDGYAFNNLTYKPSARSLWKANHLGGLGQVGYNSTWTKDGRQWRTECDTALTGKGGCRAWTMTSVAEQYTSGGRTQYRVVKKWVFNNIVKFS